MITPEQKLLSKKPLGYLLAVLGGTFGGPLGLIASPLVLLILNNTMKEKDGKQPNRFLVWSLIGIIGAPLCIAPFAGNKTKSPNAGSNSVPNKTELLAPAPVEQSKEQTGVNMQNYTTLQTGMTYEEVVSILGKQGEEMSSTDMGGYKTIMYKWNGDSGFGANMNAMFQNGKLVSKAQLGLQ